MVFREMLRIRSFKLDFVAPELPKKKFVRIGKLRV